MDGFVPPNKASSSADSHRAWLARAGELADWTLARLVNRSDAWGAYHQAGGQLTQRGTLTRAYLVRHYQATDAGDIIGLHSADADNRGRWARCDIDQHGDDPVRAEANRLAAQHWYDEMVRRGHRPLLTASNGAGGYHLRILLAEAIDAARVYHFLRRLTTDHRTVGLDRAAEQFPKQADVRRCKKGLGNWLRLPGRHHKRPYWSEVWDRSRWLAGHAAIDFMLALTGDDPGLVPDVPPSLPVIRRPYRPPHASDNLSARIAAYLRRLPNLAEGQGRDDVAFHFAAFLVRDLSLSDSIALDWLERWDAGNSPPKGARPARRDPQIGARLRHAANRLRSGPRATTLRPARTPHPESYSGGRLMAAAAKKSKYTLEIEAPANGRIRRSTVTVRDKNGATRASDTADLSSATERRRVGRELAKQLGEEDSAKWREALEERWAELLDQRRRFRAQQAACSAEAVAVETVEMLDAEAKVIRRPLCLIDGMAYAAAWINLQRVTSQSVKDGAIVKHDPPLVSVERAMLILRSDGALFADAALPDARPPASLGLDVRLPSPLPPGREWSGAGVKRFLAGDAPTPPKCSAARSR